jgi:hypothetical protein
VPGPQHRSIVRYRESNDAQAITMTNEAGTLLT